MFSKILRAFAFLRSKKQMPIKGLEKGDGVWGRGKEPFLQKVFFPSSSTDLYWEQSFVYLFYRAAAGDYFAV